MSLNFVAQSESDKRYEKEDPENQDIVPVLAELCDIASKFEIEICSLETRSESLTGRSEEK